MPLKDEFGNRMKMFESFCTSRKLMPGLPIVARLDGKSFSSFTKGLRRPFDPGLSELMALTTEMLVEETNALLGYTQSDEITLVLFTEGDSQPYFNGKEHKILSTLAGLASAYFSHHIPDFIEASRYRYATFDCRVWNVPSKVEAANAVLWRELDATRNSVSMAAQSVCSHKQLMNVNTSEMQNILRDRGINWNDYPSHFKRGTYVRRVATNTPFTAEEIEKLPPEHHTRKNPDLVVKRNVVSRIEMPPFRKVSNRVGVIFDGEEPERFADQ